MPHRRRWRSCAVTCLIGRAVSDACDEHGINPKLFYRRQKELFESGHGMFERRRADPVARQAETRIELLERFHGTIKTEAIRPRTPLSLEDAKCVVDEYVRHYNEERLHGAIGYVTPKDRLEGCDKQIHRRRDQLLQEARQRGRHNRAAARESECGRDESNAFADHEERAPQDRRSRQDEPGARAPCGPGERRERAMPEVSLTEPTSRGISDATRDHNGAAPALLETAAR